MPNQFIQTLKNPVLFRLYLFYKLPAAFFSGVRVREIDEQHCVVTVPYKWFSQNPFRSTYFACLAMAAAAYVLGHGRWAPVLGVFGGGLLVGISYRTIGSGVSGVVDLMARPRLAGDGGPAPPKVGRTMLIVIGRYALLALLAYVMIARLRLHPLGLLAGASSVVAGAGVEALRLIMKKS